MRQFGKVDIPQNTFLNMPIKILNLYSNILNFKYYLNFNK